MLTCSMSSSASRCAPPAAEPFLYQRSAAPAVGTSELAVLNNSRSSSSSAIGPGAASIPRRYKTQRKPSVAPSEVVPRRRNSIARSLCCTAGDRCPIHRARRRDSARGRGARPRAARWVHEYVGTIVSIRIGVQLWYRKQTRGIGIG